MTAYRGTTRRLVLTVAIAVAFVVAIALLFPQAAVAETTYTEGTLKYQVIDGSVSVTECFGHDEEVTVPANIAGYPVNTIKSGAFANNAYAAKILLPDTISLIEEGAFHDGQTVVLDSNTQNPRIISSVSEDPVEGEPQSIPDYGNAAEIKAGETDLDTEPPSDAHAGASDTSKGGTVSESGSNVVPLIIVFVVAAIVVVASIVIRRNRG